MKSIIFETENAIFSLPYDQVIQHLQDQVQETHSEEASSLLESISSSTVDPSRIPVITHISNTSCWIFSPGT